jgi:hypothetical protein
MGRVRIALLVKKQTQPSTNVGISYMDVATINNIGKLTAMTKSMIVSINATKPTCMLVKMMRLFVKRSPIQLKD